MKRVFSRPGGPLSKKSEKNEKRDKNFDLFRKLKKAIGNEVKNDTNGTWYAWNDPERLGKSEVVLRLSKLQHCCSRPEY